MQLLRIDPLFNWDALLRDRWFWLAVLAATHALSFAFYGDLGGASLLVRIVEILAIGWVFLRIWSAPLDQRRRLQLVTGTSIAAAIVLAWMNFKDAWFVALLFVPISFAASVGGLLVPAASLPVGWSDFATSGGAVLGFAFLSFVVFLFAVPHLPSRVLKSCAKCLLVACILLLRACPLVG